MFAKNCRAWSIPIQYSTFSTGLRIQWLYPLQKGKTLPQKEMSCIWYLTVSDDKTAVLDFKGVLSTLCAKNLRKCSKNVDINVQCTQLPYL